MIKLNPESKLARLYLDTYRRPLPNNLCSYFWKVVFALLILPITCIPLKLWPRENNYDPLICYFCLGCLFYVIMGMAGLGGWAFVLKTGLPQPFLFFPWLVSLVLTGIAFGIIFLVAIIAGLLCQIKDVLSNKEEPKEKELSLILLKIKAWKEKNCPIINWEKE